MHELRLTGMMFPSDNLVLEAHVGCSQVWVEAAFCWEATTLHSQSHDAENIIDNSGPHG